MPIHKSLGIAALLFLSACAGPQVYEMPRLQETVNQAVQQTESVLSQAQTDFQNKKTLLDNLSKFGSRTFVQVEPELRAHLKSMEDQLTNMNSTHRQMLNAKSDLLSLAYNRQSIDSNQPQFRRVDDAVKIFETADKELNAARLTYTRESNAFTETVNDKKLVYSFDPVEFHRRMQSTVRTAQQTAQAMQDDLTRSHDFLNRVAHPSRRVIQQARLSEMQTLAQKYTERAQRFSSLAKEINTLTDGAKITSIDPIWGTLQNRVAEFDKIVADLSQMRSRFQKHLEGFRHPLTP